MLMEELQQAVENIGMVANKMGMSAQEFCDFLQKLATAPINISENDIYFDKDKLWIIPKVEKPIKLIIEKKDVMKIDFDS